MELVVFLVLQQVVIADPLNLQRRERTMRVLDRHYLVRTLLAGPDRLAVLVRDIMPRLEDMTPLALPRVRTTRVRELKRWRASEFEQHLHFSTLVNV